MSVHSAAHPQNSAGCRARNRHPVTSLGQSHAILSQHTQARAVPSIAGKPRPLHAPPTCTWAHTRQALRGPASPAPHSHHARPPAGVRSPEITLHHPRGQGEAEVVPAADAVLHVGSVRAWGREVLRGRTQSPTLGHSSFCGRRVSEGSGPPSPRSWAPEEPLSAQCHYSGSCRSKATHSEQRGIRVMLPDGPQGC